MAGRVIICGATDWDIVGKGNSVTPSPHRPHLADPHVLRVPDDPEISEVISSATSAHSLLISKDGNVYVFGRNKNGQLGLGDTDTRLNPVKLNAKTLAGAKVIGGAVGRNYSIMITEYGHIFGMGENKMGQLGISQLKNILQPTPISSVNSILKNGDKVVKVSCGGDFTVVLTESGLIYTFGSPEHGQLGNGTDRQYFVSASKLAFDPQPDPYLVPTFKGKKMIDIAAGTNHWLALDSDHYVYSCGFGGYGRLGHGEQKDCMTPMMVNNLAHSSPTARTRAIFCGPSCSVSIDQQGMMYLWGKWKNTGDGGTGKAWMTPRFYFDLQGWNLKCVAAGNVSLFAVPGSEKATIAWGQAAMYGELGYGEGQPKSSTRPQKVEPLEGIQVLSVSCGYGHTLILAEYDDPLLEKLPRFPANESDLNEEAPGQASKGNGKAAAPGSKTKGKRETTTAAASEDPPYGDADDDEACGKCGSSENPDELLLCDGCDAPRHLQCAEPKLKKVPEGDWFCEPCTATQNATAKNKKRSSASAGKAGRGAESKTKKAKAR